ncbi:MAG TPA: ribosome maturation factor RimP [Actinomycetota bacterium]|nr:ribosome maturation factor RimP [Actinomycetota bacterium]
MDALGEVRDLAEAVVGRRCLRLWDVQIGGAPGRAVVRVLVDADGGVDLDTVAEVSEEISRGLDLRDPIPGRYTLEVSSPGLERALRTPEHWRRSVGTRVVVKTTEVLHGGSHRIEGVVTRADDTAAWLDASGDVVEVPFSSVKSARRVFEWK